MLLGGIIQSVSQRLFRRSLGDAEANSVGKSVSDAKGVKSGKVSKILDHKEKDLHEIKLDLVCGHYAVVYLTQEKFYVVQTTERLFW